jgi:hypothetical protein
MKILTIAFMKVTSISIHQPSSYMSYKRCHMAFVQVVEHNPPIKNKRGTGALLSCHGLQPRLQAIKLLVNLPTQNNKRSAPTTSYHTMTYSSSMSDTASGSAVGAGGT